jgi:tRNA(Arg) A34 adenosine deaminase TadA
LSHNDDMVARTFALAEAALAAGEERVVISDYCAGHGLLHLRGHELYCFVEPCLMCCGAIHWAKLDRVVFSLSQTRLNELSGGRQKPGIRDLLAFGSGSLLVVGPVREDEAAGIAARYDWRARRL